MCAHTHTHTHAPMHAHTHTRTCAPNTNYLNTPQSNIKACSPHTLALIQFVCIWKRSWQNVSEWERDRQMGRQTDRGRQRQNKTEKERKRQRQRKNRQIRVCLYICLFAHKRELHKPPFQPQWPSSAPDQTLPEHHGISCQRWCHVGYPLWKALDTAKGIQAIHNK